MVTAVLDPDAPTALHAQISDWLRRRIASGDWPEHYRLPSEPDLAKELGVSRGTLRRALGTLVSEGRLVQTQGRGTFVAATVVEPQLAQRLTTLSEAFDDAGRPLATTVIGVTVAEPSPHVAALLEVPARGRVLHLERVRSQDGMPLARIVSDVRLDLAPGLEETDFTVRRLFDVLEHDHGLPLDKARRSFDAVLAGPDNAGLLDVDPDSPLLHLEQLTFLADGRPVEHSDVWLRSDRLRVTSLLSR